MKSRIIISRPWEICSENQGKFYKDNWFVIHWSLLEDDVRRGGAYYGKWFKISHKGKTVFRCLRLSANIKKDSLYLDWGAGLNFDAREDDRIYDFQIIEATLFEQLFLVGREHSV